jgi:hypothetical protein
MLSDICTLGFLVELAVVRQFDDIRENDRLYVVPEGILFVWPFVKVHRFVVLCVVVVLIELFLLAGLSNGRRRSPAELRSTGGARVGLGLSESVSHSRFLHRRRGRHAHQGRRSDHRRAIQTEALDDRRGNRSSQGLSWPFVF